MHGVSEVAQGVADHVHGEFTLEPALALRARPQALHPWQLAQAHGDRKVALKCLKLEWEVFLFSYKSVKFEFQHGLHCKKNKKKKRKRGENVNESKMEADKT